MNFQNQIEYLQVMNSEDMLQGVAVPKPLNADTLKTQIVFRCGLLEPVYSEPYIMRQAIAQFFKREQWNIEHLVNIILAEYSPIENTDRYSEHTDTATGEKGSTRTKTGSGTDAHSGTDARTITNSGSDTETHSGTDTETHSGTDTDTRTISAYNSNAYQPDNKEETAHGEVIATQRGEQIATAYGRGTTDNLQHGEQITHSDNTTETITGTDDSTHNYTEHTHGNIGVTTNQDLINQELELLRHFDVYDWIAAKLEHELFLQVY